jgi:hypothetical protein
MTKHRFCKIILGSVLAAALVILTTAQALAETCVGPPDFLSCYNNLVITSPHQTIRIPSTEAIFIPFGDAVVNQTSNTSIINDGFIDGYGYEGIYNSNGSSFALIDNRGTIYGNYIGVENDGATITKFINSGWITAGSQNFAGMENKNSGYIGTLINNGTIAGGYENFAGIINQSGATISTLINNGTITVGHNGGAGIFNFGGDISTLINSGTIYTADGYNNGWGGITNFTSSNINLIINYGTIKFLGNSGSIVTLNNMQGMGNPAGALILTGGMPLIYFNPSLNPNGNLPTNYNIIITSRSVYGQLNASGPTGTTHFGIYNGSEIAPGIYSSVLSGVTPGNLAATSGTYSGFNWTLNEVGATDVWDLALSFSPSGLAAEQQSVQALSEGQHETLIEGRSTANELLGFTRPVDDGNHVFAGGMFGSAVGYAGGQVSRQGVTLLGGIAYGSQDYGDAVVQDAATTIALAARYMFDDFFGDEGNALHPYAEIGGWVTPDAGLTMRRAYDTGGTSNTGIGKTDSTNWDYYLRFGVTTDLDHNNKLTGFGEIGEQAMDFGGYTEGAAANNPTPATVNGGELSMGVLRAGGVWTRKLGDLPVGEGELARAVPVAVTLSGAIAHSFATHSGLSMTAGGVGFSAADTTDTWGEYGARIEGHVTQNATIGIDMLGTAGGGKLGNSTHAGVFLGYEF